ncbi:unnamed protein product [Urochloa humidicola]
MAEHAGKTASVLQPSLSPCLPLLVFHHHNAAAATDEMLTFSVSQQRLHENTDEHGGLLAAVGDAMCWATPQGWVLLVEARHETSSSLSSSPAVRLWNPCTGDELPLPDIGEEHEIPLSCRCFLSHKDPSHPACAVVLFHRAAPEIWYCHAAGGWRHYVYDVGDYPLPEAYRAPTKQIISMIASFQGKLYFINSPRDMGAIDFDFSSSPSTPTFQHFDVRLPVYFLPRMCSAKDWLVEWQDRLFLVSFRFVGFDPNNIGAVQVYEMDFSSPRMCWRTVHDIGDAVFLPEDGNVAASCKASGLGLDANRIYFMKNNMEDDADLCIFDLELSTYEITRVHHHDDLLLCRKPFRIVPPN